MDKPFRLCTIAERPRLKSDPGASPLGVVNRGGAKLNGEKYNGGALFFELATDVVVVVPAGAAPVVCACLLIRRLGRRLLAAVRVAGF
jgi:hypothetical protein